MVRRRRCLFFSTNSATACTKFDLIYTLRLLSCNRAGSRFRVGEPDQHARNKRKNAGETKCRRFFVVAKVAGIQPRDLLKSAAQLDASL